MKAKPVVLKDGRYVLCNAEEATHVTLNIPGPTGILTLPVIHKGKREGTGCWTWNGSVDAPTLRPSVSTESGQGWLCHSWINDGFAQFLLDSTHEYSGKTIALLDVTT